MSLRWLIVVTAMFSAAVSADDSGRLLTIDHFVRVKSTVPAIAGQQAQVYAMWEKNHHELFRASLEWFDKGTVNGAKDGVLRLGY